MLDDIRSRVTEGTHLAVALKKHPKVFPDMYIASVKAGEAAGILSETLLKQVQFMENRQKLKAKVQSALIYPTILVLLSFFLVIFMVNFILPKILPFFPASASPFRFPPGW